MKESGEGEYVTHVVSAALFLPSTRRDFLRDSCITAWGSSPPDVWPCSQRGDVFPPTILGESRKDSIKGTRHLEKQS